MRALELNDAGLEKWNVFGCLDLTILAHLIVGILTCVLRTSTIFWSFLFLSDIFGFWTV